MVGTFSRIQALSVQRSWCYFGVEIFTAFSLWHTEVIGTPHPRNPNVHRRCVSRNIWSIAPEICQGKVRCCPHRKYLTANGLACCNTQISPQSRTAPYRSKYASSDHPARHPSDQHEHCSEHTSRIRKSSQLRQPDGLVSSMSFCAPKRLHSATNKALTE
jgi:hypothetical protein